MTVIAQGRPARPIRIENGARVPRGGTTGQSLVKASGSDYDTEWGTAVAAAAWGAITGTLSAQTDLQAALDAKQDALVSGTNIKTLNGSTILGSGDLVISASVADGDKGDITVSGSGATWTIDDAAVTLAKMANMATSSLIYRKTAGSGVPEVNTLATLKTDLGLTGTNSGDQTITLTSDVTGSGTGSFATTIANNAVTNAKAADMAANTLKGNFTSSSGDPQDGAIPTNSIVCRAGGNITVMSLSASQLAGRGSTGDIAPVTLDATLAMSGTVLSVPNDAITNAKLANVATATIKGRATAGTGDPEDLTGTQATALLDTFTSGAKGLVPASGGGTTNFLRADGTWDVPAGGGGGGATFPALFEYYTDCYSTTTDQCCQSITSNGSNGIVAWPFAGNPVGSGFMRHSYTSTSTGRAAWGSQNIANALYLRQGVSKYRTHISLITLSDATNTHTINFGFVNDLTADPTYGVFFRYTHSVNGGRWEAVTVAGGSPTTADTGVTAVIDDMTIFEIEVNAAGTSVDFSIDGSVVATITATIPAAGINLGFGNVVRRVGTGPGNISAFLTDYIYVSQEFTGR